MHTRRAVKTVANIFALFFFTTKPGPWPSMSLWYKQILQKLLLTLVLTCVTHSQTDGWIDGKAISGAQHTTKCLLKTNLQTYVIKNNTSPAIARVRTSTQ